MDALTRWSIEARRHLALARIAHDLGFTYQAALHERAAELLDGEISAAVIASDVRRDWAAPRPLSGWRPVGWTAASA
jgi:hypothetical protein